MKPFKLFLLLTLGTDAAMLCGVGLLLKPVLFVSHEKAGVDQLRAEFYVDADPLTAWKVLSDYERIPQFVSGIKVSRVEERDGDDLFLTQEAEGGFLFITKTVHVLLKVHEIPGESIAFEDVSHKDFYFYQGSWNIEPVPQGGVSVVYELTAKRNFDAPFAGDYLHGGVQDLLKAVQKEIYLRQTQIHSNLAVIAISTSTSATN